MDKFRWFKFELQLLWQLCACQEHSCCWVQIVKPNTYGPVGTDPGDARNNSCSEDRLYRTNPSRRHLYQRAKVTPTTLLKEDPSVFDSSTCSRVGKLFESATWLAFPARCTSKDSPSLGLRLFINSKLTRCFEEHFFINIRYRANATNLVTRARENHLIVLYIIDGSQVIRMYVLAPFSVHKYLADLTRLLPPTVLLYLLLPSSRFTFYPTRLQHINNVQESVNT